ncbi:MAG: gamma-glutamylcyclotransferase family protein [Bacteroidota bacterium]
MEVFFYGLFMDTAILSKQGVKASNPRIAYLDDYSLKIGQRASLIPAKGERAYGLVMSLEEEAVQKLYSEASVADYLPEEVHIITSNNEGLKASCYNLPPASISGTNTSYAQSLYELAKRLDFPLDYLAKIKGMAG